MERVHELLQASPVGEYTEVRLEEGSGLEMVQAGRELERCDPFRSTGGLARVLEGGRWGTCAFTEETDPETALQRALEMARSSPMPPLPTPLSPTCPVGRRHDNPLEPLPEVPVRDKAFHCRRYTELMASLARGASVLAHYREHQRTRAVVGSLGTKVLEFESLCGMALRMSGPGGISVSRSLAHRGGYEYLRHRENLVEEMAEAYSDMREAVSPESGRQRVILDQRLAGILVHEAFGHLSEADILESHPFLGDIFAPGRVVAPETVTICDDATMTGNPGSYSFDDEGEPGRRTVLVDRGRVAGRLHTLSTAASAGVSTTGNARAVDFRHPPRARMSCTYMEPGRHSLPELMEIMGDGLFLEGAVSGSTNLDRFTMTAERATEVRGGSPGKVTGPATITGSVPSVLRSISALGGEVRMHSGIGGCTRGNRGHLPVSYGGPHMLVEGVHVL
jgi:TldD protein